MQLNYLSFKIIQAAISVHKELGPGLLETVYQVCMVIELKEFEKKTLCLCVLCEKRKCCNLKNSLSQRHRGLREGRAEVIRELSKPMLSGNL